jgi:hypothetical protein
MRRDIGYLLAGLGTVLIVMAIVLPTIIASRVIKWPLNEYASVVLDANHASYFSASKLSPESNVSIQDVNTFKGDASAGNSSTAVWNEFNFVHDTTNNLQIQYTPRTFAFNRRTTQLVNCCGANVGGNSHIKQTGIVGYAFPINTQKQTYQVFDATANKAEPFVYSGTSSVHGIQTYQFVENVAPVQFSSQTVPGTWVNLLQSSVTLPEYYQNYAVYSVDPETGALLDITDHETQTLRYPSTHAVALLLFDANLAATPASINTLVSLDNTARNKVRLLQLILPLAGGILGVVLLVVGILLTRSRGGRHELRTRPAPDPQQLVAVHDAPAVAHDAPAVAHDAPAAAHDAPVAAHDAPAQASGQADLNGQVSEDSTSTIELPAVEPEADSK